MDKELTSKGWGLSEEGMEMCIKATKKDANAVKTADVIGVALKSDLRHIARKQLPDNVTSGQIDFVNGPVVLQIQKVRTKNCNGRGCEDYVPKRSYYHHFIQTS